MIKYTNILWSVILFVFAGTGFSCSDDDERLVVCEFDEETVEVEFRLGVEDNKQVLTRSGNSVTGEEGVNLFFSVTEEPETRASEIEDGISNVWVLQFENNGSNTDRLLKKVNVTSLTETTTASGKQVYLLKAGLTRSNNCQLFFITNEDEMWLTSLVENVSTMGDLKTLSRPHYMPLASFDEFPMTALYKGAVPVLDPDVTIWMYRMAAKLSLTLLYDNMPAGCSLYLHSAELKNLPTDIQYYDVGRYSSGAWIYPNASSLFIDHGTIDVLSSGITLEWYMPENRRGINTAITQQKDKYSGNDPGGSFSSYIELKGLYNEVGSKYDVTISLYPGENITTDFNIIRNTHYRMTADIRKLADDDKRVVKTPRGV